MRRHHITLGAKTTAGGNVISASSACTINGVKMALEGDVIYCPACDQKGHILCVGPRLDETWNGVKAALEGDWCACSCTPPPLLMPDQFVKYQTLEGFALPAQQTVPSAFDIHFLVKDDVTGKPLPDIPYRITLETGQEVTGVTDANGLIKIIESDSPIIAKLDAPYYGDCTDQAHTQDEHGTCGC